MATASTTGCWVCGAEARPAPEYPTTGYWRCERCELLFNPERSSAAREAELYDAGYFAEYPGGEDYGADGAQRSFEAARRLPFVARHAPSGRLLEVGAAAGHFVRAAGEAGYVAEGIEPAAELAAFAREHLGAQVRPATLEQLDAASGTFDVICLWHVLEHLPEPREAIARIASLLSPEGVVCLEVPNAASVASRRDGERWFHLDPAHHVAQYGPVSLRTLLEGAGYSVLELTTVSPLGYLRPARMLRPRSLAAVAKEALAVRSSPWSADGSRHELLRAAARRGA